MLPFNTSSFSNTLGASDRAAQRKALVAPFKEEFEGKPEDVLQHIAIFTHRCEESGVIEDFKFIEEEHLPPSDIDMSDPKQRTSWLSDPRRFTYGNILLDSSKATLEKMQQARDDIRQALKKFSSPPDPVKMPLASQQLVSFQNRQWLFTLLQNVWSIHMKTIMARYQELHDQDGVVLWFCFLTHFAGTTTENLIIAYSQLSETKLQLSNFNNNVLQFTNAVRTPIRTLIKAKESPTFQHFLYVFHGAMDAPNEEFCAFIIDLYSDYRKGGLTKQLSMLDLLDKLDTEYNRINNLGRWTKKEDSQLLALTASLQDLQNKFSSLQGRYSSLQALVATKDSSTTTPTPTPTPLLPPKLNKPPAHKEGEPEIVEFENRTWKWCDKCFGGSWNRTHVTNEHQPGKGRSKNRRPPASNSTDNNTTSSPSPSPPTNTPSNNSVAANVANTSNYTMDFV
jgi:hypothetical protein